MLELGGTARGEIHDTDGRPARGVVQRPDAPWRTSDDAAGRFTLEHVLPGEHTIDADVEVDGTELEVTRRSSSVRARRRR